MTGSNQGNPKRVAYVARLLKEGKKINGDAISLSSSFLLLPFGASQGRIVSSPSRSLRPSNENPCHSRMVTRHHSSPQSTSNSWTFLSNPLLSSPSKFETHERLTTEPDLQARREERQREGGGACQSTKRKERQHEEVIARRRERSSSERRHELNRPRKTGERNCTHRVLFEFKTESKGRKGSDQRSCGSKRRTWDEKRGRGGEGRKAKVVRFELTTMCITSGCCENRNTRAQVSKSCTSELRDRGKLGWATHKLLNLPHELWSQEVELQSRVNDERDSESSDERMRSVVGLQPRSTPKHR